MSLPDLPYAEWEQTQRTLHLYLQIIGKIRLNQMPRKNHWWYITLYVNSKGITTSSMPCNGGMDQFEIQLNFLQHQLEVYSSQQGCYSFPLREGLSVASFYHKMIDILGDLDVNLHIMKEPYDLSPKKPFKEITDYHFYDHQYIERFWKILLWVDSTFKDFSGKYYGKTSPVHIYWHHMDLAVTRFSGKKTTPLPSESTVADKDAYSHEVVSFGFWSGDPQVQYPAFYSYTYPAPDGINQKALAPEAASWIDSNGSPMALVAYEDIRNTDDPTNTLLSFLESAYQAGASTAGWDIQDNVVPSLSAL